jgi:hypothetical protein
MGASLLVQRADHDRLDFFVLDLLAVFFDLPFLFFIEDLPVVLIADPASRPERVALFFEASVSG